MTESAVEMRAVLHEVGKAFNEVVPPSTKVVILDLKEHPLWMEIGKTLSQIALPREATTFKLVEGMRNYLSDNNIGYLELDHALEEMVKKGYLTFRQNSERNFFPTLALTRALNTIIVLENKVVKPAIELSEQNPTLKYDRDLRKKVTDVIYDAIR